VVRFFRNTIFPLFLIIACPTAVMLIWYTNVTLAGSLTALWQLFSQNGVIASWHQIWGPIFWGTPQAYVIIGIFMVTQLILMRIVPGKRVTGPITPHGNVPIYKENGFPCYLITLALFYLGAFQFHWFSPAIIYDNFGALLGALNIFSLVFCLFLYIKGRVKPSSSDCGSSGNFIFDYYWGTELYPRVFGWDIKVFTNCRIGMMSWPIIILSFAAKQTELYGLSNSMIVAVIIMMVYLTKFFIWETGYMRSMDIMHDRAGYYICWGCLVWVPGVYTSPILYLVNHPNHLPWLLAAIILILGVTSVLINYFADAQRQKVRATNGDCKVWGKKPEVIHATYTTEQGQQKQSLLLVSGWWSVSRHFHYLPEILGAFFWTVPALFIHPLPYFYVIFLTALLVHRSLRDEERCQKKYGKYWDEYCQRVPTKMIPAFLVNKINSYARRTN
jgi:7-dehydrocholesterol reductase